jgi:hypothetical protein
MKIMFVLLDEIHSAPSGRPSLRFAVDVGVIKIDDGTGPPPVTRSSPQSTAPDKARATGATCWRF